MRCGGQRINLRHKATVTPMMTASSTSGFNRLSDEAHGRIAALLEDKHPDFGLTLAAEKLLELDGIAVSREYVRRLQIERKLWKPKRRRARGC
jgi:hypothetical protein